VGRFPREKYDELDAVFAAAEPLPAEVEIPGVGKKSSADALVWELGELDTYCQLNRLEAKKLTPSKLSKRLHAIVSAVGIILQELKIEGNFTRFGWQEQLRNGLQAAARREAERIGGFPNHPPRTILDLMGDKEITEYHEDRQFDQNIEGFFQILRWAREWEEVAKLASRRQDTPERKRAREELECAGMLKWPEIKICDKIFEIWVRILGKKIGASTYAGSAAGPLIRFTTRCLVLLECEPLSEEAIRWRIRLSPLH
jgi:hypothetical protein